MDGPGRSRSRDDSAWNALIERLYVRARGGMVLGLERVEAVLAQLAHPERASPMVHIAGSNGKGSTAAFLTSILAESGRRVGLFTSPHLDCLSERVQIAEPGEAPEPALRAELLRAFERLESIAPSFLDLTFFELVTLAALLVFRERGVDACVIEAGLGARLDATRLVDARVSVLTQIALEHTSILGSTLEAIAAEKMHVARADRPLVMEAAPSSVIEIVERHARDLNAPLFISGRDFVDGGAADGRGSDGLSLDGIELGLAGDFQRNNARLAVRAAQLFDPLITDDMVRAGLERTRWPGRLETLNTQDGPVLLDGAHNPSAVNALLEALDERWAGQPVHMVVGFLSDKAAPQMLARLAERAEHITLCSVGGERGIPVETLLECVPEGLSGKVSTAASPEDALLDARRRAARGWVLVSGSLHLVGRLRSALT